MTLSLLEDFIIGTNQQKYPIRYTYFLGWRGGNCWYCWGQVPPPVPIFPPPQVDDDLSSQTPSQPVLKTYPQWRCLFVCLINLLIISYHILVTTQILFLSLSLLGGWANSELQVKIPDQHAPTHSNKSKSKHLASVMSFWNVSRKFFLGQFHLAHQYFIVLDSSTLNNVVVC